MVVPMAGHGAMKVHAACRRCGCESGVTWVGGERLFGFPFGAHVALDRTGTDWRPVRQ